MHYLAWYIWSKTFRSKPWTWKRQHSSILTAYADNFYLQLLHLSKKGARYRSLKHTTAIICSPGASVRPKHRLETSDSCMHIHEPNIRKKTLGHQGREQLIIYFYICWFFWLRKICMHGNFFKVVSVIDPTACRIILKKKKNVKNLQMIQCSRRRKFWKTNRVQSIVFQQSY